MNSPEIIFILYKPGVPGNVGSSARAIKTMGFSRLRLISPCDYLGTEARMLAHGSNDILENAEVYDSFEKAIEDIDLLLCTTAKQRSAKVDYLPVNKVPDLIRSKGSALRKVAILFGTEESGLPNDLIRRSDTAITIPMSTTFPSLNLSQAVMVTAWELSSLGRQEAIKENGNETETGWKELKERSALILELAGIPEGSPLFHRIMERLTLIGEKDTHLLHSVTSKLLPLLKENKDL